MNVGLDQRGGGGGGGGGVAMHAWGVRGMYLLFMKRCISGHFVVKVCSDG